MNAQSPLEEKHDLLKSGLNENLEKKHALELRISKQFEELKRIEISIEKCARATTEEWGTKTSHVYDFFLLTCCSHKLLLSETA